MSEEVKPCPWCKSSDVGLTRIINTLHMEMHQVECGGCGNAVMGDGSSTDAVAAWNDLSRTVQAALSEREKRLQTALEFYADKEMWKKYGGHSTIDFDEGRRARSALADTTNTGG